MCVCIVEWIIILNMDLDGVDTMYCSYCWHLKHKFVLTVKEQITLEEYSDMYSTYCIVLKYFLENIGHVLTFTVIYML